MKRRNFVREIKAKDIKDINPYDIIYLALKDGSIVLVVDDEETIEYDDIKSEVSSSQKRNNANFYNNKFAKKQRSSYSITDDTESNNLKSKYSYYSKDKNKTNYTKKPVIVDNKKDNYNNGNKYMRYNDDREKMNKSYNYGRSSYNSEFNNGKNTSNYYRNERTEKSFDNIKSFNNNNFIHKIEYINNNPQRPKSTKSQYNNQNYKNNINTITQKTIITSQDRHKTPKRESKNSLYSNNLLINISEDKSMISADNSFMNKTQLIEKKNISKNYFSNKYNANKNANVNANLNVNSFNRGQPIRSQSLSNRNSSKPQTYFVQRREMEIMGRIVNDDNSCRLIDHKHPNTLFEPRCPHCQNLARKNKLSISNIKEESIYDNHSFLATFGGSGSKRGKSHSNFYKAI